MKEMEYKTLNTKALPDVEDLNLLGANGWIMICMELLPNGFYKVYFYREVE